MFTAVPRLSLDDEKKKKKKKRKKKKTRVFLSQNAHSTTPAYELVFSWFCPDMTCNWALKTITHLFIYLLKGPVSSHTLREKERERERERERETRAPPHFCQT